MDRNDELDPVAPALSEISFRKLLRMVTTGVEFSFNDIMFQQVDGVAMGSPLGPVLAKIFVGYCESQVPDDAWPSLYRRFVDDVFACCDQQEESEQLLRTLNGIHPSLRFTCEHEVNGQLPYMDVLVEKTVNDGVLTSVYRKPTFTGLYTTWDSFRATKHKINLVKNLVHRARRICSPQKLQQELDTLKSIFLKNGYPSGVLSKIFTIREKNEVVEFGPKRCPVVICLPWKGDWCNGKARDITSMVKSAYYAVNPTVVLRKRRAFQVKKDVLPTPHRSCLVYQFECRNCESRYVGRTLQRLNTRIQQHVPLHLLNTNARADRPKRGRPRKTPSAAQGSSDLCGMETRD